MLLCLLIPFLVEAAPSENKVVTAPGEGIPPVVFARLPHRSADHPAFVSASAAFAADGMVNTALFAPSAGAMLGRQLDRVDPLRDCIVLDEFYVDRVNPPDRSTLAKAVQTSELILQTEVVSRDYGFESSVPGQLLRVRPVEVFKGEAPLPHYFVFLPVGTFEAGPHRFCKTDYRYPEPPEIGEQVLLLVPEVASREEPYLALDSEASIIAADEDGTVRLPLPFRDEVADGATVELASVVRQIEEAIARGGRQVRRLALPLSVIVSFSVSFSAHADTCLSSKRSAGEEVFYPSIYLDMSQFPGGFHDALVDAQLRWNDSQCNYQDRFPILQTFEPATRTIRFFYEAGFHTDNRSAARSTVRT